MKIKLNLIPQYRKDEIRQTVRFKAVLKWEIELFAVFLIFFSVLLSINYILKLNLSLFAINLGADTKSSGQYKEIENYDAKIRDMTAKISGIEKIQKGQIFWSRVFEKINEKFSDGLTLDGLTTKNYNIFLTGKAKTRDELILFKTKLEEDECFSDVNLPLSNLVTSDDIDFKLDFKVLTSCIK